MHHVCLQANKRWNFRRMSVMVKLQQHQFAWTQCTMKWHVQTHNYKTGRSILRTALYCGHTKTQHTLVTVRGTIEKANINLVTLSQTSLHLHKFRVGTALCILDHSIMHAIKITIISSKNDGICVYSCHHSIACTNTTLRVTTSCSSNDVNVSILYRKFLKTLQTIHCNNIMFGCQLTCKSSNWSFFFLLTAHNQHQSPTFQGKLA